MFEIGVRIREKRVEPGFPAMVDCEGLEGLVMMGDGRADIHFFIQTVKDGTYGLYPYRNNYDILYSDQRDIENQIGGGEHAGSNEGNGGTERADCKTRNLGGNRRFSKGRLEQGKT